MSKTIALVVIGLFMVAPQRASSNPVGPFPTTPAPLHQAPNYWDRGLSTLTLVSLFYDCVALRKTSLVEHQEEMRDYCSCLAVGAAENALVSKYSDGDEDRNEWGLRGSDFAACSTQTIDTSFGPRTRFPLEAREYVERLQSKMERCIDASDAGTNAAVYCGCAVDGEAWNVQAHGEDAPEFRESVSRFCTAAAEYHEAIRSHLPRSARAGRVSRKPDAY